ncbi:MAG TPA: zf-HC2 domain-containing protein [Chloroflexia bacterium]|nr:zf-HC2 domain-containing protein [Chloroflexia bacterium]
MFCREVKLSLSDYLDGQLDHNRTRTLEEHVATCPPCRKLLELMEAIPAALQTDRMLAPRPEFTTLVMQRIVVRQHLDSGTGSLHTHTEISSYAVQSSPFQVSPSPEEQAGALASETDSAEPEAKIISLAERRAQRSRTPGDYVLRFSSLAAAFVLIAGAGLYVMTQSSGSATGAPTAAVYVAIQGFADTVRNALSSPVEVAAGVIIAAAVLIGLWYTLKTLNASQQPSNESNNQSVDPVRRRA